MKNSLPLGSFRIIIEPGLQNMLQIVRVTRDGHETLLLGEERDRPNAGLVRATTRAKVVADPVMHAITILNQTGKTA